MAHMKYFYRNEIPSNEEGFRPIQFRINDPKIKGNSPRLITLSSGRYFYPFSILDLDNVIKELCFIRELLNGKKQ